MFKNSDQLFDALVRLGDKFGHPQMRKVGIKLLKQYKCKTISQLPYASLLPFFEDVKTGLLNGWN